MHLKGRDDSKIHPFETAAKFHFLKFLPLEMEEKVGSTPVASAREVLDTVQQISELLETGLDSETLAICVHLCEQGVNPEALASVVKELRREMGTYKASVE